MADQHAELVRGLTYPLRRFGWWLRDPETACRARYCARPIVGFSVWCRQHTDHILEGRTVVR